MNAADLAVFDALFASVAEEMGVALERAATSTNIKERRDLSCAVFDAEGNPGTRVSKRRCVPD